MRNPLLAYDLRRDEVHIWTIDLEAALNQGRDLHLTLSSDEIKRAERFRSDIHRSRFIVSRALMRFILSEYISIKPEGIIFRYNSYGKPFIYNQIGIKFSFSRSDRLALLGVTSAYDIGIDIERLKEVDDLEGIARRFFTNREYTELQRIDPKFKVEAFLRMWTCKEAYAKAVGFGLSLPLNSVEVLPAPSSVGKFVLPCQTDWRQWHFETLYPEKLYIGALATPARASEICHLRWPAAV